ncbi:DUF1501 domain-containing protein [Spirilliplanes yamanashiensis]|uniref:DUF1501 domain-containing protein n=1 Tax=Spirilliplanes yamanashiensis TaxID=42233 RepID=A0A8J3Y3Z2_9ACTN|nr:DUF1501 domain-containing protein [Spirilliplanes yamanashiensis]MDP9820158.1 uncharacterized protein (DUF1501 family) [Spirilliplanes yamanashiensis]GIJ01022.1 hypothetical protein Sya03_03740 [Spirilliplanes yamanashiensis]
MSASCCGTTRRKALGAALAAGVFGGLAGDQLATQLAFAADTTYTGDVLVVLSLRGGFDGLSAVVPYGDPYYYRARPTIGVPRTRTIGNVGGFGLNPALRPLLPLWANRKLAAVHAVGQAAPNRSHFSAMEELERAAPGTSLRTGWLDRLLGVNGASSPFNGVSVGTAQPQRTLVGPSPDLGLMSVDGFQLTSDDGHRPISSTLNALYANAPAVLRTPAQQLTTAVDTTSRMATAGYAPANGAAYPGTPLGGALRDVARMIKGDVGLMTACVDTGDWDLHENLGLAVAGQRMYDRLHSLALALAAFAADLGADLNRVTLVTVSEFGRRVAENGSKGLDHGYGNAMLVLGGGVHGGRVYGRWPTLNPARLVAGDLAVTTDYRAVIGEILQKRCRVSAVGNVFPGVRASALGLVASR